MEVLLMLHKLRIYAVEVSELTEYALLFWDCGFWSLKYLFV